LARADRPAGFCASGPGAHAARNGANIPLVVTRSTLVKFYHDHKTHWVTDNFNTPIVVAVGNFQSKLGCKHDDDAGCLRTASP
jgi:hypothetical protein